MDKYRLDSIGWMVSAASYSASGMLKWKLILSVKTNFEKCIRYQAYNGQLISFWKKIWCSNSSLQFQLPSLYLVC